MSKGIPWHDMKPDSTVNSEAYNCDEIHTHTDFTIKF